MNQLARTLLISLTSLLAACASPQQLTVGTDTLAPLSSYTAICDIKSDTASYSGKIVRVRGTYRTDTAYYAYLESSDCQKPPKAIEVDHPVNTQGDETVIAFFALEAPLCKGKTVCPIAFTVDADILIKQTDNGLFAELKHVHYAKART